jgi:hypothetical protein
MATVTQFRLWNNVPTRQVIDTSTGEIKVYLTDAAWKKTDFIASGLGKPAPLLASASGKDWETTIDLGRAFRTYNPSKRSSSDAEVNQGFQVAGRKVFDNDRANVLNTKTNYDTQEQFENNTRAFYTLGIPRIRDPFNGLSNNSNGVTQTEQTGSSVVPGADPQGGDVERGDSSTGGSTDGASTPLTENNPPTVVTLDDGEDLSDIPPNPVPILRYPELNLEAARDLGITYDYIKIQVVDYVGSLDFKKFDAAKFKRPSELYFENTKTFAHIILPMQPNLSSSNSTSWGEDNANLLQLLAGGVANKFFSNQIASGGANLQMGKDLINDIIDATKLAASGGTAVQQEIAAFLAGQVINTRLLERATGSVINPNMEMLFNGPRLRQFNFTFDMTPRTKKEAENIRQIIKTFKKYMAPRKAGSYAFLKAPKIFLLNYIYNGDPDVEQDNLDAPFNNNPKQHPYLNKIKPCALTNFDVNYTPSGSYMTYRDGGSMTTYQISMSFAEIEPVYNNDIDLNSNDMGY